MDFYGTLFGETLLGESDEFFEKWRKFRPTNNFAQKDNHILFKLLVSLLGSLEHQLKALLLLLGEIFRRRK